MSKLIELDFRGNSAICKVTGEKPLLWNQDVGFRRDRTNCVHCAGNDNDYISYDNIKDLMAVGTGDFTFVTWFRHFKTGNSTYFSVIGAGYLAGKVGGFLFHGPISTAFDLTLNGIFLTLNGIFYVIEAPVNLYDAGKNTLKKIQKYRIERRNRKIYEEVRREEIERMHKKYGKKEPTIES